MDAPTGIFYVTKRDNYEEVLQDFFPYIKQQYVNIARNFQSDKKYPVLAVSEVTLVADDDTTVETARFLVPTENGNFLWVLSEVFVFAGLET
ncbi:MAG: hypothetical protein PF447_04285 [Spirochaetaceae bacterium]|jgi:hypothetical protein|nr:hypothetical protein [Spirochaetaceae bacterium]